MNDLLKMPIPYIEQVLYSIKSQQQRQNSNLASQKEQKRTNSADHHRHQ